MSPDPTTEGEWFDLTMTFPLGLRGTLAKRTRLEKAAIEKLLRDTRARNFDPVAATVTVEWLTPFQGKASIFGVRSRKGTIS